VETNNIDGSHFIEQTDISFTTSRLSFKGSDGQILTSEEIMIMPGKHNLVISASDISYGCSLNDNQEA